MYSCKFTFLAIYIYVYIYNFIALVWAVLGLHYCASFFSSCGK